MPLSHVHDFLLFLEFFFHRLSGRLIYFPASSNANTWFVYLVLFFLLYPCLFSLFALWSHGAGIDGYGGVVSYRVD